MRDLFANGLSPPASFARPSDIWKPTISEIDMASVARSHPALNAAQPSTQAVLNEVERSEEERPVSTAAKHLLLAPGRDLDGEISTPYQLK